MNAKSKERLQKIAEKWLGKPCTVLFLPAGIDPYKGGTQEACAAARYLLNHGEIPVVYHEKTGMRVCHFDSWGGVSASVHLMHPQSESVFSWWKAGKIRLAI